LSCAKGEGEKGEERGNLVTFVGGVADDGSELRGPANTVRVGEGRGIFVEVDGGIGCQGDPKEETAHCVDKSRLDVH
jgi:hypothetical protein